MTIPKRMLSTKEAATYVGLSESFLEKARVSGKGCPYCKISDRVLYDVADLDLWLESAKRRSTSDHVG